MATGAAAELAAQQGSQGGQGKDDDRGPGSVSGNMVRDPELRYTDSGTAVCNLRVAYTERVRDPATGRWADAATVFYDVQCWGTLAENTCNYIEKGDRIVAEGRWVMNKWKAEDGTERERIVLRASELGPSLAFRGARVERKGGGQS